MHIIITRDNIFDCIVALHAINANNAIDVRTIANAMQTTTKITRRHLRTLRDTSRIVYANRVAYAIMNDDDQNDHIRNDIIARRNNTNATNMRRDATTRTHDTSRDIAHVETRTRATINMMRDALNARMTRRNVVNINDNANVVRRVTNDDTSRHVHDARIDAMCDMLMCDDDMTNDDTIEIESFNDDDAIDAFIANNA